MTPDQYIKIARWLLGAGAVVAAFLLAQPEVVIAPVIKVALGAYLAFAAYANPETLVGRLTAD